MSAYTPEEYKPDGGFSMTGLPVLILLLLAIAAALGWLASFIGQWFYLILVFPLGIGLVLIFAGNFAGRLAKLRNMAIAGVLGLMSAAAALLVMHYCDYQRFVSMRDEAIAQLAPKERLLVEALAAKKLLAVNSFLGFMDYQATEGVTIGRRGGGINIGYYGTWIYWGLEFLGVAVLATFGLIGGAAAPFCSACDTWKEERQLGTLQSKDGNVAAFLQEGKIDQLREQEPARHGGDLLLSVAVCPKCQHQATIAVKLEAVSRNDKGEESKNELVHLSYPGEALADFEAVFAAPAVSQERKPRDEEGR